MIRGGTAGSRLPGPLLLAFYILIFAFVSEAGSVQSLADRRPVIDPFSVDLTIGELTALTFLPPASPSQEPACGSTACSAL
jgi:hypothetical protein